MFKHHIAFALAITSIDVMKELEYKELLNLHKNYLTITSNFNGDTKLITYEGILDRLILNFLDNITNCENRIYHLIILDKDSGVYYEYGKLKSDFYIKKSSETKIIPIITYRLDEEDRKL